MGMIRSWKYRLYPSKMHQQQLNQHFHECKNLWNYLLEHTKDYYKETCRFPTREQLYLMTKQTSLFSQLAQNVADRLYKSIMVIIAKKKSGKKAGFPRFKSFDRIKSFTYPQFGFRLDGQLLHLSGIGDINIKKHRDLHGKIKTLTIKKTASGKYFAIFTTELDTEPRIKLIKNEVGIDLGVEYFAYLSNGETVENPRHLKHAEEKLKQTQRRLSNKKKGSRNRRKARVKLAVAYEKLTNKRRDFLHKISRKLVEKYSFLAMENLDVSGLSRKGFLAKHVLDCSWAEFVNMIRYKAEEAGSEVVLVDPAHTSQKCSNCGLIRKKTLAERWHNCSCEASMHRDHNAAINILKRCLKAKLSDRQETKFPGATQELREVTLVEKKSLLIINVMGKYLQ